MDQDVRLLTSSRVARKAVRSSSGMWRMKPTVSVKRTSPTPGRKPLRVRGRKVAKSLSSPSSPARVRARRRVVLPALV